MISLKSWFTLAVVALLSLSSALAQKPGSSPHIVDDPPLTPAEQLKKFHLPPGFEIQLVAAEPEIRKPINMAFDSAGRLVVTGSIEYPYAAEEGKGRDTVVRFTIGPDGRATKHETVVEGMNIPIGIAPYNDELFVFSIPRLLRARDTNGDGRFDEKTPLITGFGAKDTHGMVNNITPWIDGWIYTCHGYSNQSEAKATDGSTISMQSGNTFRWRPDGTHIEQFTHGQVNPFGMAFDPLGNLFTADCHTLPAYQILRGGWYPSFGKPHDGLGYAPTIMSHQHGSTGIAGIVYYSATQFPPEYRDAIYIGNPITARVNFDKLKTHGSTFEAIEQPDFVSCDDRWFRPVDLKLGPDGALYIADFYNRIIGHYEVPLDHPQRDRERGRIWRVVYTGKGAGDATMVNVAAADIATLWKLLGHDNIVVRTLATNRLAAEQGVFDRSRQPDPIPATKVTGNPKLARVHSLWVQYRLRNLSHETLAAALTDADRDLRVHAVKVWSDGGPPEAGNAHGGRVEAMLKDPDPFVRRAAAEALGYRSTFGGEQANFGSIPALLECWKSTPTEDTHLIHTLRMSIRNCLLEPQAYSFYLNPRVEDREHYPEFDQDAIEKICNVSLGVPTEEAAKFILAQLRVKPDNPYIANRLEHVVRYLPEANLPDAYALAESDKSPLGRRADIMKSVQKAVAARGTKVPDRLRTAYETLIVQLLQNNDANLVRQGIDLARDVKSPALFAGKLDVLTKPEAKFADLRGPALEAAVACNRKDGTTLAQGLLGSSHEPIALRQKAAQVLGTLGDDAAAHNALAASLATAPERLGIEIAAALGNSKSGAQLLLATIEKGKATPWLLKEQAVTRSLRRNGVEDSNPRVVALTAKLPARNDRLAKLIEDRRNGYLSAKPDVELGKALFVKNCKICHRLSGDGNKIGPELDGIGVRGLDRILEDVLDPNRNVDQTFRALQVETKDGRTLTGLKLRDEGEALVMADAQGKELRIAKADIDAETVLPNSPMPANVADILNETEFRHLVAFLLQQRQTPVSKQ
jgi:putative heme-binding domain-containing protein